MSSMTNRGETVGAGEPLSGQAGAILGNRGTSGALLVPTLPALETQLEQVCLLLGLHFRTLEEGRGYAQPHHRNRCKHTQLH